MTDTTTKAIFRTRCGCEQIREMNVFKMPEDVWLPLRPRVALSAVTGGVSSQEVQVALGRRRFKLAGGVVREDLHFALYEEE